MTATEKKIDQIVQKISSRSKPEKIIVFGSTANGGRHANSDIDLVVIQKSRLSSWEHHRQLDKLIDHSTPVDMLVYTPDEITERLSANDPFVINFMHEGTVVYEKQTDRHLRRVA